MGKTKFGMVYYRTQNQCCNVRAKALILSMRDLPSKEGIVDLTEKFDRQCKHI